MTKWIKLKDFNSSNIKLDDTLRYICKRSNKDMVLWYDKLFTENLRIQVTYKNSNTLNEDYEIIENYLIENEKN